MLEYLEMLFATPALPGTILLGVCLLYGVLLILGAIDFDLLDFDAELPAADGNDGAIAGIGLASLRFMNLGDVPVMLWVSFFALAYVASSLIFDRGNDYGGEFGPVAASVARSCGIALVATKLITQPLRGKFDIVEPNKAETLVDRTCTVTTSEVTPEFGQARVDAEGAPLLLHVRSSRDNVFHKNDIARIVAYDADRDTYTIEPVSSDSVPSDPPQQEAV